MDPLRPMFHGIASAVQLFGLIVIFMGGLRVVRAPSLAAGRAARSAGDVSIDPERRTRGLPDGSADRERYARGLTDFYRISGAVAVIAGIVLLLVPVFAG